VASDKIDIKKAVELFRALADPTRCKILVLLWDKIYCVCELTAALELAQPTISRHLRILEQAGFVESKRKGQRMEYALNPEGKEEIKILLELLKNWLSELEDMKELRKKIRLIALNGPCPDKN